MKGYVIKVTYLTGRHKGKTYLMKKGGYITEEHYHHFESDVYTTLRTAKRVCTVYRNNNERDYKKSYRMKGICKVYYDKNFKFKKAEERKCPAWDVRFHALLCI